jgi:hypothetical protein
MYVSNNAVIEVILLNVMYTKVAVFWYAAMRGLVGADRRIRGAPSSGR